MIFYFTLLPLLFILFNINKYDTYEIYLNSNSNLITNFIYKISNYWSLIENNFFFILIILLSYYYIIPNKKIIINNNNIIIFIAIFLFKFFNFYINSNLFYSNNSLFNPLLTHFLVFIHPPMIITLLFLMKLTNFKNKNIKYYFYFFTFTLFLGSYWATSVFGWGGWWSWDPIENISLIYWFLFLFFIHKKTIYNFITYYFIFAIDLFLFFFLKFNNFQSIHLFKIVYINIQDYFIIIYIILLIIVLLTINKKNMHINKINILYIINKIVISIIIFYLLYFYIHIYINNSILFYILIYLTILLYIIFILIQPIKNIIHVIYFLILTLTIKQYYLFYAIYTKIIYKYKIKKNNYFFNIHFLFLIVIYILYLLNNIIIENVILFIYGYENVYYSYNYNINEIDLNINYIEYNYKLSNQIENLFITNYYNLFNIFEKIEFNIYNYVFNNLYLNIKNNIIQIYIIKYIVLLFSTILIIIL